MVIILLLYWPTMLEADAGDKGLDHPTNNLYIVFFALLQLVDVRVPTKQRYH